MKKIHEILFYMSFTITVFLGAFLLFQVEPIISKYILPWFGGSSSVWTTSLLFFQTVLLGGYFYAYLLTKLAKRIQVTLHFILIIITSVLLLYQFYIWSSPITPSTSAKLPDSFSPILQVIYTLFISVGLPYFLLTSTSTLLQKWQSHFSLKKSPYSLYAVSNMGSLLGIISYPFVTEPFLSLHSQGEIWSIIFLLFCLLLIVCSIIFVFKKTKDTPQQKNFHNQFVKLSSRQLALYLFIPAVSSIMLLAGTNQLTQELPPFPFLWIMPLALYLLSFILCFSETSFYRSYANIYSYSFFLLVPIIFVIAVLSDFSIVLHIILFSLMLFCCFMICHNELYRAKPPTQHLNAFYLLISLGSVFGACIVAIIAPLYFIGMFWEFYFGLFFTACIAAYVLLQDTHSQCYRFLYSLHHSEKAMYRAISIFLCWSFVVLTLSIYVAKTKTAIKTWRNFYGLVDVTMQNTAQGNLFCLVHGRIIHGCQFANASLRKIPTTYFGVQSGVGLAIQNLRNHNNGKPLRIGILGLGIGTLAAYGQKGDTIRFYEINPQVIDIAEHYFSYLTDSPANITIALGDARLSLEKELQQQKPGKYNLLAVDVYNDDAIPTHLLTKEAVAVYKKHLANSESILAFHISTTYYDLSPVIVQLAREQHMSVAIVAGKPDAKTMVRNSYWALLSEDKKLLQTPEIIKETMDITKVKQIPLWTDDYSNVVQILR